MEGGRTPKTAPSCPRSGRARRSSPGGRGGRRPGRDAEEEPRIRRPRPASFKARLDYLIENITYEVFNYARRGLFEKHKLIVATMLVLRVMQRKNDAPADQVEYLIMGKRIPTRRR